MSDPQSRSKPPSLGELSERKRREWDRMSPEERRHLMQQMEAAMRQRTRELIERGRQQRERSDRKVREIYGSPIGAATG